MDFNTLLLAHAPPREKGGPVGGPKYKICVFASLPPAQVVIFILSLLFSLSVSAITSCDGKEKKLEIETPKLQKAC